MDDIDRAQEHEEKMREMAISATRSAKLRDYESEICIGCSYATKSNFGKNCEAWVECLHDLQSRERKQ